MLASTHALGTVAGIYRHISVTFSSAVVLHTHPKGLLKLRLELGFLLSNLLVDEVLRLLLVDLLELGAHLLHGHLWLVQALTLLFLPLELLLKLLLPLLMLNQSLLRHQELGLELVLLGEGQHVDGPS